MAPSGGVRSRRTGQLTNSATSQAQVYGFELGNLNIYTVYDLLEFMKGLALQTQSCRTSMTQGNNTISKRSPSEVPILIV